MLLELEQKQLRVAEVSEKYTKVKGENSRYEKIIEDLELQKQKLLEQNTWLESMVEQAKEQVVERDYSGKIQGLEKEIEQVRKRGQEVDRQKDIRIEELEEELLQLNKDKEYLNLEFIKLQKAYEIEMNSNEVKYKKALNLNSSRLSEKPSRKLKASLQDAKKSKLKKAKCKDIKYHSDTEDIMDLPSKKLTKESKKAKSNELTKHINHLESALIDKESLIALLTAENSELKAELDNVLSNLNHLKHSNSKELSSLQQNHKEVLVKYERLLLDHQLSKEDPLSSLKDQHATLKVENELLIGELQSLKTKGFKGTDSMMRMVDEIEDTREQERQEYEHQINQLKSTVQELESQREDLMRHIHSVKHKIDGFNTEVEHKDNTIMQLQLQVTTLQNDMDSIQNEHLDTVIELKEEIDRIKESNQSVIRLYEYHTEAFRDRVSKEIKYLQSLSQNADIKDDNDNYSNLLRDLAQRDAVCKNLKEENKELKQQVVQLKTKNRDSKMIPVKDTPSKYKIGNKDSNKMIVEKTESDSRYSTKECEEIIKRIALIEAENIKLSSKFFIYIV